VVEHTKHVVYLEDNDLVHLVGGAYGIFNVSVQVRASYVLGVLPSCVIAVCAVRG
jgi:hypothetical protein